jgi:hypothetical protein
MAEFREFSPGMEHRPSQSQPNDTGIPGAFTCLGDGPIEEIIKS